MALSGMGTGPLLRTVVQLFGHGEMATSVWPKSTITSPNDFIGQAHFRRMRRRIEIARAVVPELHEAANRQWLTLNGKKLLGFELVLERLACHPNIKGISLGTLGDIHGDLNLQ